MTSSICRRTAFAFLLLIPACGSRRVEIHGRPDVTVPCAVEEGDQDFHALLTSCMYARERFAVLFGRPAYPVTIDVHDSTAMLTDFQGGRVVFHQPSMRALSRARSSFSQEVLDEESDPLALLGHEIGHMLLFADTYDGMTRPDPRSYGTLLPDWMDEAVAIWSEPEESRALRMETAASLSDSALDLGSFQATSHPFADGVDFQHAESVVRIYDCYDPACPPSPFGRDTVRITSRIDRAGVVHVDTVFPEDAAFRWLDTEDYYAIASTILPFLHRRGGPALVNVVLERMLRGTPAKELFAKLPGLPPDPADVSREWRTFVRAAAADTARSP